MSAVRSPARVASAARRSAAPSAASTSCALPSSTSCASSARTAPSRVRISCTLRASARAYSSGRVSRPPLSLPTTTANRRRPSPRAAPARPAHSVNARRIAARLIVSRKSWPSGFDEGALELFTGHLERRQAQDVPLGPLVRRARRPARRLHVHGLVRRHDDQPLGPHVAELDAVRQPRAGLLADGHAPPRRRVEGRDLTAIVDGQRQQVLML